MRLPIRCGITCLALLTFCAAAHPVSPPLPAEATINQDAGSGGLLFVTLRLQDGKQLPFVVDTGTPCTIFDKSLAPKLGKRVGTVMGRMQGGPQGSGVYAAPKLYLGHTRLMTGANVFTYDFSWLSSLLGRPIMGILGMDCLRHYCLQLDFTAGEMRLLDPNQVKVAALGKTFPLTFSCQGQSSTNFVRPYIHHPGLLGGTATNALIDTGDDSDGQVEKDRVKGHYLIRVLSFLTLTFTRVPIQINLRKCVWDGETYTNLGVLATARGDRLGLRFLARHLVTLDFPKRMMYLKQTSVGPRTRDISGQLPDSVKAAAERLFTLKENSRLPGWSRDERGTVRLGACSQFVPKAANAKGAVYLEAFARAGLQSATLNFRKRGDSTIYHYVVHRVNKDSPWKLQKAWQTDSRGHVLKKFPVP